MQDDFHYNATYLAAILAGYKPEEAFVISYSAQFVDCCSATFIKNVKGPVNAATTQLQLELMEQRTDIWGLQEITRIWAAFHFLPYDLKASLKHRSKLYMSKYRLLCNSNGALVKDTVKLAKGGSLEAVGIAMHVLADTWAHKYFAGTPTLVLNDTNDYFFELLQEEEEENIRKIKFRHSAGSPDEPEKSLYTNSLHQDSENNIMNLGHGRAGHLPDYSFIRYKYMPAWGNYKEIIKDNPSDYYKAFCQMVYALKYLKGDYEEFKLDTYAYETVSPFRDDIMAIICKRQLNARDDWRDLGARVSGAEEEEFDVKKYQQEYLEASKETKKDTFLGRFFGAAIAQKSMVTNKIFETGNLIAGYSINASHGMDKVRDVNKLVKRTIKGSKK